MMEPSRRATMSGATRFASNKLFRTDLRRNPVAVALVATRNNDASPGLSQNRGNGTAHSFGSAGHERNASGEIKCIQRVGVHFVLTRNELVAPAFA